MRRSKGSTEQQTPSPARIREASSGAGRHRTSQRANPCLSTRCDHVQPVHHGTGSKRNIRHSRRNDSQQHPMANASEHIAPDHPRDAREWLDSSLCPAIRHARRSPCFPFPAMTNIQCCTSRCTIFLYRPTNRTPLIIVSMSARYYNSSCAAVCDPHSCKQYAARAPWGASGGGTDSAESTWQLL